MQILKQAVKKPHNGYGVSIVQTLHRKELQ